MSLLRDHLETLVSDLVRTRDGGQFQTEVALPFLAEMLPTTSTFEVVAVQGGEYVIRVRLELDLEDLVRQLGQQVLVVRGTNITAMAAFCIGAMTMEQEG